MRARLMLGVLWLALLCGCNALWQGTRGQCEAAGEFPARALQSVDRPPLAIPTAADALRDPVLDLRIVPATIQGTGKQVENALER